MLLPKRGVVIPKCKDDVEYKIVCLSREEHLDTLDLCDRLEELNWFLK